MRYSYEEDSITYVIAVANSGDTNGMHTHLNEYSVLSWSSNENVIFALQATRMIEISTDKSGYAAETNLNSGSEIIIEVSQSTSKFTEVRFLDLSTEVQSELTTPTNLFFLLQIQCECSYANTFFECFSNSLCLISTMNSVSLCTDAVSTLTLPT